MGRVAIETHGCKLNQADSEALARRFVLAGWQVVEDGQEADVFILNTCTVTHVADSKARGTLNAMARQHPNALVVATGCYAQRKPEDLQVLPSVDLVVAGAEKQRLVELVLARLGRAAASAQNSPVASGVLGRARSAVKIQEGCNQVCAYCIVPKVRGRERSVPPDEIVRQVRERVAEGYQEVVLTGTQLGSYGFEWEGVSLERLVARVLRETDIARLRVSSVQPQELTESLLALWRDARLCPHFHIPLQSGSASVLARMRRRYTPDDYRRTVERVWSAVPHATITTDVIVGFPGETEEEHRASLRLCQEVDYAAMHVFPFSTRAGTTAAHMVPKVEARTKKRRTGEMLALAREKMDGYRQRALGQVRPVLWERIDAWRGQAVLSGLTDTYLRVYAWPDPQLVNRIVATRLTDVRDGALWGLCQRAN